MRDGLPKFVSNGRANGTPEENKAIVQGSIGFFGRDNQNIFSQNVELSFDLFMQMRNKVVSAYQEIMRMPM